VPCCGVRIRRADRFSSKPSSTKNAPPLPAERFYPDWLIASLSLGATPWRLGAPAENYSGPAASL
jgi:hypothetical protein